MLEANRDKFPQPASCSRSTKFGGWDNVEKEFFDEENGSIFEIQRELGNPTE